ncbi:GCN5-related N-acetyltransferase [Paenibacillus curdlanolyticus YK9]|uniref:GCN5-related N-acetyltransferase n=1 Tax=Paenibacillus curdlanolyticus YK9 TaxID=717606 RepID=E0I634_9BACL|nr:GNAT family N-acetyltransferase [Paenibacillus curdlanolyticus]EFM12426.1 GCN5-related N-acetyltransferase [Paenibacillus curdlanolyticus YK9]
MINFSPSFITDEHVTDDIVAFQAREADTEDVLSLLIQTAEWFKRNGSTQWSGLLQGEDSHNTQDAIVRGHVYGFRSRRHSDPLAGMVMLLPQPSAWDRELWGEEGHDGAVYLHRLAISRAFSGLQLGEHMMKWAERGIRFPGQDRIRLDCIRSNPFLNNFYQRMGYTYIGESYIAALATGFSKFEKLL